MFVLLVTVMLLAGGRGPMVAVVVALLVPVASVDVATLRPAARLEHVSDLKIRIAIDPLVAHQIKAARTPAAHCWVLRTANEKTPPA